ncbi:MAG: hypothetical protein C0594_13895 [Marinilabiliales bacterium]|nr:MAG: hypothetical protein C0594_13895 [Marinilabiliales bacterium]
MKKIFSIVLIAAITSFFMAACTPDEDIDPDDNTDVRDAIEGLWQVDENANPTSKSDKIFYQVYIEPDTSTANEILISNFYQLGMQFYAVGKVTERAIRIDPQEIGGGYYIEGNGTITSDYKTINWDYTVDPGDGMMQVQALYTKDE